MQARHIIIGDIHGCAAELFELLELCERRPRDEVVSVGDLVDRGPDPEAVIRFFMQDPNSAVILGNHEDKHLRIRSGELRAGPAQLASQIQLGDFYDEALDWFATLPLSLERAGHFICHAGVIPDVALEEQPRSALLRAKMPWMKDIFDQSEPPWWERYDGAMPVVYGHSVHVGGVHHYGSTWGLDTGVCHGGALSALILPSCEVVSVEAECDHYASVLERHGPEIERRLAELEAEREEALAEAEPDVVLGRHLIERGMTPGPEFGPLLARCREVQEETGWADPDRILDRVLGWVP